VINAEATAPMPESQRPTLATVPARDADGHTLVVIETPKGSAHKYKFDPALGAILVDRILPAGLRFPLDFGFFPRTVAEDGDPLDVLLVTETPIVPGCVIPARVLGVLEAEQHEIGGEWFRNDRVIAAAAVAGAGDRPRALRDLDPDLVTAVGAFFVEYNRLGGRGFRVTARRGPAAARRLIDRARRAYERQGGRP